jgi:hypothetical protein
MPAGCRGNYSGGRAVSSQWRAKAFANIFGGISS